MQSVLHECPIFQILASVPLTGSGYVGGARLRWSVLALLELGWQLCPVFSGLGKVLGYKAMRSAVWESC